MENSAADQVGWLNDSAKKIVNAVIDSAAVGEYVSHLGSNALLDKCLRINKAYYKMLDWANFEDWWKGIGILSTIFNMFASIGYALASGGDLNDTDIQLGWFGASVLTWLILFCFHLTAIIKLKIFFRGRQEIHHLSSEIEQFQRWFPAIRHLKDVEKTFFDQAYEIFSLQKRGEDTTSEGYDIRYRSEYAKHERLISGDLKPYFDWAENEWHRRIGQGEILTDYVI